MKRFRRGAYLTPVAALGGGSSGPAAPTATATMTQLSSANRIYQRDSLTGGGGGKGQGVVPVTFSALTVAGTLNFRCSSGGATRGDLQAETAGPTVGSTGAQTVNFHGVDARLGWFYLDVKDASGWTNGTTLIGMGRGIILAGPSQIVRMIGKMPTYAGTNASLGVTISPNTAVYASYADTLRTSGTIGWAVPADATDYDGCFVSEFSADQSALAGVNVFIAGRGVGSSAIASWIAGGTNNLALRTILDAVGGFEAFYFVLGGNDMGASTSTIQTGLSSIFTDAAAHNAALGSTFERYVSATATRSSTGDTFTNVMNGRKDVSGWAAVNSATYLEPHDVTLFTDGVHQDQPGNITWARHTHRATYPALGGTGSDIGPSLASATRATNSNDVVVSVSLVSSSALSAVGATAPRFGLFASGDTTTPYPLDPATPIVVGTNTITFKIAGDPGNTQAIDVYAMPQADPSATTAYANMIYDSRVEDGQARGRQLQATILGSQIVVAAPGGSQASGTTAIDTFTAANGTDIVSRACDTGQFWTAVQAQMKIFNNRAYANGTNVMQTLGWAPRISGNYKVTAVIRFVTFISAQSVYVAGRVADLQNFYQAGYRSGSWTIGKTVNNVFSALATSAVTIADGDEHTIELRMTGTPLTTTTLEMWVDGSMVLTTTDNAIHAAGRGGIRNSGAPATTTTGAHIDSITMTDV